MDQRPVQRRFRDARPAVVERIGAVPRCIRIPARSHTQKVVDGDRAATVVRSRAKSGAAPYLGVPLQHRRTDQRRSDALGDRPCALRHGRPETGRIALTQNGAAALNEHGGGARSVAMRFAEGLLDARRQRANRYYRIAVLHVDPGPLRADGMRRTADRQLRTTAAGIVHRDAGRHIARPLDDHLPDLAIAVAIDRIRQVVDHCVERALDPGQFPRRDALGRPRRAVSLGIGDRATQEQCLVACRQRAVIARRNIVLRGRLGGERRGGQQRCGGESMSHHARLVTRLLRHANKRGRTVSRPAPLVLFR